MTTRLQLVRGDVFAFFDHTGTRIHKQRDLERILSEHREAWRLAESMTFAAFLDYLLKSRKLRRFEFPFPHRREVRYVWGKLPFEVVLLTLKRDCHFSHFTAVQLHELTEQSPQTIYLNHEQPAKPVPPMGLAQERIDRAFRAKPRTTRNVAVVRAADRGKIRVCLLNSKHTGNLGVEERELRPPGEEQPVRLKLTDIERTLIDIAVRPFYAGGVEEVLKAYRGAAARGASVNRLAGMLRKLAYVYPYHQAIGFYLEAAGFGEHTVELFRGRFEYEFDFYLSYGMSETEYVPRWRLYVPKGLSPQAP